MSDVSTSKNIRLRIVAGEKDENTPGDFSLKVHSPEDRLKRHVERPRWNWKAECIRWLLFPFVIAIVAIALMMLFMPSNVLPFAPDHRHRYTFNHAAVAAGHRECSVVGKEILEVGGNAVDAAIAATFCQGVLEPYYSGIGGGAGMTIYNATTKKVTFITSREKAPAAATADMFINATGDTGGKFIAVPGELMGLSYVYEKYGSGKLQWSDLLEPAIKKATDGFPISQHMETQLQELFAESVHYDSYFCDMYCNHDKTGIKKAGEIVKNIKLAETLTNLQQGAVEKFYQGEIAEQMIKDIQDADGIMTMDDLKNYNIEEHAALIIPLQNAGYTIHAPPLPYGGPVIGAMLTIMDIYNVTPSVYDMNNVLQWHRVDEAFRHSFGAQYSMGDPNFQPETKDVVDKTVSGKFALEAKNKILDDKTFHDPKYYGAKFLKYARSSTSHLAVLDPNKNAVSSTSTVNHHFGAKVISASTGILYNNEMDDFSFPTGDPNRDSNLSPANQIEGGKRPLSSMSPIVITDDANNEPAFIIGAAGGKMIPTSIANILLRLIYFTNDDDFVDAIRAERMHDRLVSDILLYEEGFKEEIIEGLKRLGHNVALIGPDTEGDSNLVNGIRYHKSHIYAFSDMRNDGAGVSGW